MIDAETQAGHDRTALFAALGLTALALALFLFGIQHPVKLLFDETHYVPAARTLWSLAGPTNIEHPLLGKILIGLGIQLFGDNSVGWRIMSALFGALALLAAMRATWWAGLSRAASILTGLFLLTGQLLFIQSRIGMLDIFMVSFFMVALWLLAAACRHKRWNHARLAGAGVALGLAMACKWTAVPLAMTVGLGFALVRVMAPVGSLKLVVTSRRSAPIHGVSLIDAALWLGLVPLIAYFATFAPAFFYYTDPLAPSDIFAFQLDMYGVQSSPMAAHPYQSGWQQWMLDLRPIWYLYEPINGVQRGILFIGNPVVMWAGLIALPLCLWLGLLRRRWDMVAVSVLYAAALLPWMFIPKPVQFYYHYFLAHFFLCAALAMALDEVWLKDRKWVTPVLVAAAATAMFVYFYPIIAARPLENDQAFNHWMWFDSWR